MVAQFPMLAVAEEEATLVLEILVELAEQTLVMVLLVIIMEILQMQIVDQVVALVQVTEAAALADLE
jgi:hypothetical protein